MEFPFVSGSVIWNNKNIQNTKKKLVVEILPPLVLLYDLFDDCHKEMKNDTHTYTHTKAL